MDGNGQRDVSGRFAPGWRGGPGRRRGQTVSAELRRQADPEAIAARLLEIIYNPKTPPDTVIKAVSLHTNRTEGTPLSRSVVMTARQILPAGFDSLSPEQKRAVALDIHRRALADGNMGELPLPDDENESDDDEG